MDKVVKKLPLKEERLDPLYETQESMQIFFELLKRGRSFYPNNGTSERYPRVYRIAPLKER